MWCDVDDDDVQSDFQVQFEARLSKQLEFTI